MLPCMLGDRKKGYLQHHQYFVAKHSESFLKD